MIDRKARFLLRGDLMVFEVHYDPLKTSAPMADKSSVRLVTSIASQRGWILKHMDMKSTYIHTIFKYLHRVYLREPDRVDGSYKNGRVIGRFVRNVYVGLSGAYYFIEEVFTLSSKYGFKEAQGDPCLFSKRYKDDSHTVVAVYSDYHLVTIVSYSSFQTNIYKYHALLNAN